MNKVFLSDFHVLRRGPAGQVLKYNDEGKLGIPLADEEVFDKVEPLSSILMIERFSKKENYIWRCR
jgi:hypothetical protein